MKISWLMLNFTLGNYLNNISLRPLHVSWELSCLRLLLRQLLFSADGHQLVFTLGKVDNENSDLIYDFKFCGTKCWILDIGLSRKFGDKNGENYFCLHALF